MSPSGEARLIAAGYIGRTLGDVRKLVNRRPRNPFELAARGKAQGNKRQPGETQVFNHPDGMLVLRYPRDGNTARLAAQLALQYERDGDNQPVASAMRDVPDPKPDLRDVRREFKKQRLLHAAAVRMGALYTEPEDSAQPAAE
jgi:hypothetical protein